MKVKYAFLLLLSLILTFCLISCSSDESDNDNGEGSSNDEADNGPIHANKSDDGFVFAEINGVFSVIDYVGSDNDVVIPST